MEEEEEIADLSTLVALIDSSKSSADANEVDDNVSAFLEFSMMHNRSHVLTVAASDNAQSLAKNKAELDNLDRDSCLLLLNTLFSTLEQRLKKEPKRPELSLPYQNCLVYLHYLFSDIEKRRRYECFEIHRNLMGCFEHLGMFQDVLAQGKRILNAMSWSGSGYMRGDQSGHILPNIGLHDTNAAAASKLVINIAMSFLRAWEHQGKDSFSKIIPLVFELEPWFGNLDENYTDFRTFRECVPMFFKGITLSLLDMRQEPSWVVVFCKETFLQFEKASVNAEIIHEFAHAMCASFFSNKSDEYFSNSNIPVCVLKNMLRRCEKHPEQESLVGSFMSLSGQCASGYGDASLEKCSQIIYFFRTSSKVQIPGLRVVMEHYALALVIEKFDAHKDWPNHIFEEDATFGSFLTKLDAHLEAAINVQTHPELNEVFSDKISTLIVSKYKEMLSAFENSRGLPNISSFLVRSIKDFNTDWASRNLELTQKIVNVAVACLLVPTKQDTEGIISEVIMKKTEFQETVVKHLFERMEKVSKDLCESFGNEEAAIGPLISCCEAAWMRVKLFCVMLKTNEYGVSKEFSSEDDSIVHLVKTASQKSALLLSLLRKYKSDDVNSATVTCVNRWLDCDTHFCIPIPVDLIKSWVTIQCDIIKEKGVASPTLYSLVQSLKEPCHKQQSAIIFEQELSEYRRRMKVEDGDQLLYRSMETNITQKTVELKSREELLGMSERLLTYGIKMGSCGHQGEVDCIAYIKEGINFLVMKRDNEGDLRHDEIRFIIKGHLLISLYERIAFPRNKDFTDAIKLALSYWRETKKFKLSAMEGTLVFYVADLLSLEGYMELQSELYNLVMGCYTDSGKSLEDLLDIVLQSGNMCHSLCSSPVDDAFIKMLLKHRPSCSNVAFWKLCAASKKSGIDQIFSVFPTLRSTCSPDDAQASGLITKATESDNPYADACLDYNLSERLLANGLYVKALNHANGAYLLREELLSEHFIIEWDENDVIKKFAYKQLHTLPSCILSLKSHYLPTDDYVPTSWNIVRLYLESALKTGMLTELIGNREEAAKILFRGLRIANFLDLPLFFVSFSTAIGKACYKMHSWDLALEQLENSKNRLKGCKTMCCKKCRLVLKSQLNQVSGDLHLSHLKILVGVNDIAAALEAARNKFQTAESKIEGNDWKNHLSEPCRETTKVKSDPVLCQCNVKGDGNCLHCVPMTTENSSLESLTYLKWECVRRRHLLHIQRKQAKCAKLHGDIVEEHTFLMSSIKVLVARSTFHNYNVSMSYVESLLTKEVAAEAFGLEHASILYDICCFSLKHSQRGVLSADGIVLGLDVLSAEGIVLGLKMAFILSREDRQVHEKVSRLLAALYYNLSEKEAKVLKSSSTPEPQGLTTSHWSAYFHQSSIGTFFNTCFLSKDRIHMKADYSGVRDVLMPDRVQNLEKAVMNFFKLLPGSVSIVCISLVTDTKLYSCLFPKQSPSAWIMFSRMKVNSKPRIIIKPCETIDSDLKIDCTTSEDIHWSPWGNTVVDTLLPGLRKIRVEDQKFLRNGWEKFRGSIESKFEEFMIDLENKWVGFYKNTLVRDLSDDTRDPVVIVPDLSVQVIPWESLPILQKEEVYRMMSVGSILCTYKKDARLINPQNSFYLLDKTLEGSDESWTGAIETMEGMIVGKTSVDELKCALKCRDIFLYNGHNDGRQYIPSKDIRDTQNSCVILLMGCGSGYITSSRLRVPDAAILDFLLSGSPAVVANICTVTNTSQNDITKTVLESWTLESSTNKKRRLDDPTISLASSIRAARAECKYRYLDGYSCMIFGDPTNIQRKMIYGVQTVIQRNRSRIY